MEEINGLVNIAVIPLTIVAIILTIIAISAYKAGKTKLFNSTWKKAAQIIVAIIALMVIKSITINLYSKVTDPQFLFPKKTAEQKQPEEKRKE